MTKTPFYLQFRDEHAKWVAHNFPNAKPHEPLLGITEELGELVEASLHCDYYKERDAVGDMLVYLTHYCNIYMLDWIDCLEYRTETTSVTSNLLDLITQLGKLAHAQLKGEQSIRHTAEQIYNMKRAAIGNLVLYLEHHCNVVGFNMMVCLEHTWNEVKERDWKKNNITGK